MRKAILKIMLICLTAVMLLVSCEEYSPAIKDPSHGSDQLTDSTDSPDITDEGDEFTVTLRCGDKNYAPLDSQPISVQWNDGYALHTAPVGKDGVARISGLDGDYRVTLSEVPIGYGYDPNIYKATSDEDGRNVTIELYRLNTTRGRGDKLYEAISIRNTGVYCIDIEDADDQVFFQFEPAEGGTYAVTSWMDAVANTVNPTARYYGANPSYKELQAIVDDGGESNTYTKNFKLEVQIADEQIGANMQPAFTFGVSASAKDSKYPIRIYFAITLDGEFKLDHTESTLMIPQEELVHQKDYDPTKYEFVGAEFSMTSNGNTANVFDSDNYRMWSKNEGGDNYYHLYDEVKYASTEGYGPILYAKISSPCRFIEDPFTSIEYRGNKALTLADGTENYKLFIEGFEYLNYETLSQSPTGKPPYFCVLECPCRASGTCDSAELVGVVGACITGCEKCHPSCRTVTEEAIGHKGYGNFTNMDGCYGVTEELRDFLQKYSISQWLFFDGQGFVETHDTIKVFAGEDDQWLFACGYYKEIEATE